jgi:hypothetical protein
MRHNGIGCLTAVAVLSELGDARRFSSSRKAVRHTGLDVTVYESDGKRAPGRLSHQGPPVLRWALYEAATTAASAGSPDHAYYLAVKAKRGSNRARLAIARKLMRRAYDTLRRLGDQPSRRWPDISAVRAWPMSHSMRCGQLLHYPCRHDSLWFGPGRLCGRPILTGFPPSPIMCPDSGPCSEKRQGACAHDWLTPMSIIHAPPGSCPLTTGPNREGVGVGVFREVLARATGANA